MKFGLFLILSFMSMGALASETDRTIYYREAPPSVGTEPLSAMPGERVDVNPPVLPASTCAADFRRSQESCEAPSEISMMIMAMGMMFQGGDVAGACTKMSALYGLATTLELKFAQTCRSAANRCISSCSMQPEMLASCKSDKNKSIMSYIQASVSGTAAGLNAACAIKAKGDKGQECDTYEKIYSNHLCPGFCGYAKNWEHEQCKIGDCNNPQNKDLTQCFCQVAENKSSARCATAFQPPPSLKNPNHPTSGISQVNNVPNNLPLASLDDDFDEGIAQDWYPEGGQGSGGGDPAYGGQGGGSPSALGGGGGQMGGGGGGGPAPGPYNADIHSGYANASGGGSGGGGGGGYAAPQAAQGGGYGMDKEEKFDWQALLPKVDKKRGPAGVDPELYNNGITAANGLSNFEKVSRKMNEKRSSLLP